MAARLAQWERGEGFAGIRADWLDARRRARRATIRVRLPEREIDRPLRGLDEAGRLLLRLPTAAVETITAGDVFPLRRAAERLS